jgi:hypothetical protein
MNKYESYVLAGFVGGIARGLSSYLKNVKTGKPAKFNYSYFFTTVFFSGILGGIAGALSESSWKTAFLAGYAGIDFIENLYKSSPFAKVSAKA